MSLRLKHIGLILTAITTLVTGFLPTQVVHAASNFDRNAAINDTTHYDPSDLAVITSIIACAGDIRISGDNVHDAFVFLVGKGLSPAAASAIIGNLMKESTARLDPTIQQDRSNDAFPKDGVGFGIAQWTYTDRQKPLVELAKKMNQPANTLSVQLTYLWQELNTSYKSVLKELTTTYKNATDPAAATDYFREFYEGCNPAKCDVPGRIQNAKDVLALATSKNWFSAPVGGTVVGCVSDASAAGDKIVKIAMAEVGTAEVNSNNGGPTCKYQGSGCPQFWCADFVSWVYKQAGVSFTGGYDGGWRISTAIGVAAWFKKHGTWIPNPGSAPPVNDPRAPRPGDVMYYPPSDPNSNETGHVNIVASYDGKTVKTVGGNQSDAVRFGTYVTNSFDVNKVPGWGRLK